jgi:hypothetical protein
VSAGLVSSGSSERKCIPGLIPSFWCLQAAFGVPWLIVA